MRNLCVACRAFQPDDIARVRACLSCTGSWAMGREPLSHDGVIDLHRRPVQPIRAVIQSIRAVITSSEHRVKLLHVNCVAHGRNEINARVGQTDPIGTAARAAGHRACSIIPLH